MGFAAIRQWMEEWLYPVEPFVPHTRTRKMQVLALGLSRSGTDSLRTALETLGYDHVYHGFDVGGGSAPLRKAWTMLARRKWGAWKDSRFIAVEDFDRLLGHCEAATDQPCACFPLELIEAYPEARVILNYRDPDPWILSIEASFGTYFATWEFRYLSYFEPGLYWLKQVFMFYDRGYYQGSMIRNGRRIQQEHYAKIRGSVAKERLLEWKVQDGWVPLCEFLEKPVPEVEFPSGNTPEQTRARAANIKIDETKRAYGKMAVLCIIVFVLGIAVLTLPLH